MSKQPNILVFMADHLMADLIQPNNPCLMPNARRMMEEGITFSQTYCPSPHCCPSRASFFTGEYPSVHGVWNNVDNPCVIGDDPSPETRNLGQYLGEAGYQLGFSGKWHISNKRSPRDFGWREYDTVHKPNGKFGSTAFIKAFHDRKKDTLEPGNGVLKRPGWGDIKIYDTNDKHLDPNVGYYHDVLAGIKGMKEMARSGKPWCNFISVNPPHDPYDPPGEILKRYQNIDTPLPKSFTDDMRDKPRIYQRMRQQYWGQMNEDENRECLKRFYALTTMVDDWLGLILKGLEETGQKENTIVLFTSDHGDYAGAHGLWCKGVPPFREAYAIPAVMRWPEGIVRPGRTVDELVSLMDFLPTFTDAATGRRPDVFGQSLMPFLSGNQPDNWRQTLFTQLNGVELYYTQRTVFTRDWKYAYNGFDIDELYDLRSDPLETINLANPDLYDQSKTERNGKFVPWPRMNVELEGVRERLLRELWQFARDNDDGTVYTPYYTTCMAPYGPDLAHF